MAEAGVPGYEMSGWNGIFAVKGTPPEIVVRLHSELAKILHTAEVRQELAALGAEPVGDTPEEFAAFLRAETARWGKIENHPRKRHPVRAVNDDRRTGLTRTFAALAHASRKLLALAPARSRSFNKSALLES